MVKREQIELYEKVFSQMETLYKEISILSKNKPDNPLNKFKLRLINEILREANILLDDQSRPFVGFEVFDEEQLPFNSDAVLILSGYITSLSNWKTKNTKPSELTTEWMTSRAWVTEEESSPDTKQSKRRKG